MFSFQNSPSLQYYVSTVVYIKVRNTSPLYRYLFRPEDFGLSDFCIIFALQIRDK